MSTRIAAGRRLDRPTVGWLLSALVYGVGVVHLVLFPSTGGVTGLVWHPGLYAALTNEAVLTFVYVPLIQLPLAVLTLQRLRTGGPVNVSLPRVDGGVRLSASRALAGMGLLAAALAGLWLLGQAAVGIGLIDAVLDVFRWGVGWLALFWVFAGYFPLLVVAVRTGRAG